MVGGYLTTNVTNYTVILPCYNDHKCLLKLLVQIRQLECKFVVADSSEVALPDIPPDSYIRPVRGLTRAILEGIEYARTDKVVVMDCDGQHPIEYIPKLVAELNNYDLAIGSRYIKGGRWLDNSQGRKWISILSNTLTYPLTGVRDATSGFFALKKSSVSLSYVDPNVPKILLAILTTNRGIRIAYQRSSYRI